jgi:hypothetical protein
MNSRPITPAQVLKVIRDNSAIDHHGLDKMLGNTSGTRQRTRSIIYQLTNAGLIKFDGGGFSVTDEWMKLQGLLGISLTTLIDTQRASGLTVNPMFGIPNHLEALDIFVVMSFEPNLKPVYEDHIKKVAAQLKLAVRRADDFFTAHAVIDDIWAAMYQSKLVVADCTGRNANVYYEIGMAHTIGKPVILTTQNEPDVPFDLRAIRYIHYSYTPPGMQIFEERLAKTIAGLIGSSA